MSRYINNISVIEKLEKSFAELRFRLFINSPTYKNCQDFRRDKNKTGQVGRCLSLIFHQVKSMVLTALVIEATLFFIRIYFIRISRLKFAKISEYFKNKPETEIFKRI